MRDYYSEFVTDRKGKTPNRPHTEGAKGTKASSAPFAPSVGGEYPENNASGRADRPPDPNADRGEIFEERIAIMMFDGGLSEADAVRYVAENPD